MTDPVKIIVGEGDITEVNVPEYNLIQTGGGGGGSGSDGATFFPEVSEEGVISWTNDGGYDNPEPVNIKGPAGNDGSDGEDGEDGVSPTVSFTTITGGHTMTVTDKDHPSGQSINIMDGEDGTAGTDGTTFTPAVDTSGNLSWTNDGGKQNPPTVNIKGPQGVPGEVTLADLNTKAPVIINSASGDIASFADGADSMPIKALTINVEPIQAGSGDPSPDNVRPISGRTSVTVTRTGKNLLDPSLLKDRSAWNTFKITVEPNTWYTCSTNKPQNSLYLYFKNMSGDGGGSTYLVYNSHPVTVKSTAAGEVWISQRRASGSASFADYQIMIAKGSTASAYEPYQCNIYTIQLGDTVYGGTLDVTGGKMVVDRANIASYNGETLPGEWISDRDVYSTGGTPTIGAQVVYFLATPFEITLSPTQIDTLLGQNNIWSDAGTVNVTYCADTELFINGDAGGLLSGYRTAAAQDAIDADMAKADEVGIVITGKRPSMTVTAGQYVIVCNSTISGITDGLYTANTTLSPSTDVTAANLTAVSGGGLNAIQSKLFKNIKATATDSTTAGSSAWIYVPVTVPDGYRMVAVNSLNFSGTDATYIVLRGFVVENSNSRVTVYLKNTAAQTTINWTVTLWITCAKEELFN